VNPPLINPRSRGFLDSYLKAPAHGLLLTGQPGVGLRTIAEYLARELAGPNRKIVQPTLHNQQKTANINIDDVRQIVALARSRRRQPFVIIIDEVEKLTENAPQAILKVLEEPTQNLHFILTSHQPTRLPATVKSRLEIIQIMPLDDKSSHELLKKAKITTKKSAQIMFLARGRPAEICRLLSSDDYFRAKARQVETVKQFLAADTYQRLVALSSVKDRTEAIALIETLAELLTLTMSRNALPNLAENLMLVSQTLDNLASNGNIRAQLANLAVNML
jgi:DNA polymerase III delta prime subunit